MSIFDYRDKLKAEVRNQSWKLYIDHFPSWIAPEDTWPVEHGVAVTITENEKATNVNDGTIVLQFHDDEMADIVRRFLSAWETGLHDPQTNTSRSPSEMCIPIRLVSTQKVMELTLQYPKQIDYRQVRCEARYGL